jgi:D-glycero-D-manno-heptose 1,7-bisphosphate phosphatase
MGVGNKVMRRAAFLDRDGVINRAIVRDGKPHPPAGLAELELLPGVPEALSRLRKVGFLSIVVTNQPDVARGASLRKDVEAINEQLRSELALDAILVCWHDDAQACDCRKPKPGLLLQAARDYGVDLPASYMVGDRWRDIEAGRVAGCRTVWINRGYKERAPEGADYETDGLPDAVDWILEHGGLHETRS